MSLAKYIAKRIILAIPVFFAIVLITFTVTYLIPTDPVTIKYENNPNISEEELNAIRHSLGLDQPFHIQFFFYLSRLLQGDMGYSIMSHRPVSESIWTFFTATFELSMVAFLIVLLIGIPLGVISATKRNTVTDNVVRLFSLGGVATPTFWLGLVLQLIFYSLLGILPIGGRVSPFVTSTVPITNITGFYLLDSLLTGNWVALVDVSTHMILPALCMAYSPIGRVVRITRSSLLDVLQQDYVRTARASGFSERVVIYVWALRNALIPVITVLGLIFGLLLRGSVLIETVFSWPGLGRFMTQGIMLLDYPVIIAVSLVICCVYVAVNLIVDVLYTFVDPRITV